MTPFEKNILRFATRLCRLERGERIVVGLSGGADSVALLLLMKRLDFDVMAAHCNFHLRGSESDRDENFCRELCDREGVELVVGDFDVVGYRVISGSSVEMACRELRYDWWRRLLKETDASKIAVGHHREDNIETFFLNLLRGSGLAGLKGMLPVNGDVVRPLLQASRNEIEEYLLSRGVTWVNDSTNFQSDFRRNRLRNDLLPMLEQLFPGGLDGIERSIDCLRDNYHLFEHFKARLPQGNIDLNSLMAEYGEASGAALFEALMPRGFNRTQTDAMLRSARCEGDAEASGKTFVSPSETLHLHSGVLSNSESVEPIREVMTDDPGLLPGFMVTEITADEFRNMKPRRDTLYLDADLLPGDATWTQRGWRVGDRLAPFGMKGSRLVSDIFSDAKIPREKRVSYPLIFHDRLLLWVVGLRTSRHFPVTAVTRRVLCITAQNEAE